MPRLLLLVAIALFVLPATALAAEDVPPVNDELVVPSLQFYALLIGSVTPLAAYLINTYAPWVSEPVKAFVQIVLAAAAGVVIQLLKAGDLALDTETLQVVWSAVATALFAHRLLWLPSGLSAILGGGENRNLQRGEGSGQ